MVCLIASLSTAGCLLGPPPEAEDSDEEEFYAPSIDITLLDPTPRTGLTVETADLCAEMHFSLGTVTDRNTEDELVVRWFLDWEGPGSLEGWEGRDRYIPPTGNVDRRDPIALTYVLDLQEQPLAPNAPHSVTAIVADRTLRSTPGIEFSDDDEDEAGWVYQQWDFTLEQGGDCDVYVED